MVRLSMADKYITVRDPASFANTQAPLLVDTSGLKISSVRGGASMASSLSMIGGLAAALQSSSKAFASAPTVREAMLVTLTEV